MPTIACPHCKQPLTADVSLAGQIIACPLCTKKVRMPASFPGAQPAPQAPPPPPPMPGFSPAPKTTFSNTLPPPPLAPEPRLPEFGGKPDLNPYAPSSQPAFLTPSVSSGGSFRAREYPALRLAITALYVLAGLIGVMFVLSEIMLFFSGASAVMGPSNIPEDLRAKMMVGGMIAFLFSQFFLIIGYGSAAFGCVISAELIRVWLDVQNNTHESAHYVKALYHNASRGG